MLLFEKRIFMKKIITLFLILLSTVTYSQDGVSIMIDGETTELSGGTYTISAPSLAVFDILFNVFNTTGVAHQWRVTREKISVPQGWADGLCWGHSTDQFGGTCFTSGQMNTNPWTTPSSVSVLFTINDGESGKMKSSINPDDFTSGTAHYRYYISDDGINYTDSVDLIVDFTAAVKPQKELLSASIGPNPAADYIYINLSGAESATIKMIDIVGNIILKETISATKKLDVSNLNSGVYIINFEVSGAKTFSRKVIVRH